MPLCIFRLCRVVCGGSPSVVLRIYFGTVVELTLTNVGGHSTLHVSWLGHLKFQKPTLSDERGSRNQ